MRPKSLYLHVPFSARRGLYSGLALEIGPTPPVDAWLAALEYELETVARDEGWSEPLVLRTLYIGGGEPALLGTGAMEKLRRRLEPFVVLGPAAEWTVEASPENVNLSLARDWQTAGVNRLSLGVQSFHPATLQWLGHSHTADAALHAVDSAHRAGIEDIDLELVFGVPDRLQRDWSADLERGLRLEPTHMTLSGLDPEPGTVLDRRIGGDRGALVGEERFAEEYTWASGRLRDAGYTHYEVTHFAVAGHESRHTRSYWTGEPYLGLGPGAHSYLPPVRRWNLERWPAYRSAVSAGESVTAESEIVDGESARLERIWLGLRTRWGLARRGWGREQIELAYRWAEEGLAEIDDETIRLTPAGWLLLDRLVLDFEGVARRSES